MPEVNSADTLWAWVTELPDGAVSQVGAIIDRMHTSLISRSRDVAERMRPLARAHRLSTGQRVWLREYTGAVDHGDA